jgi:type III secretion protein L
MAIWLRKDKEGIAISDGVVRRDAWLQVGELHSAFSTVEATRNAMIVEAHEEVQRIIDAANDSADERRVEVEREAQEIFDAAQAEGMQCGAEEWNHLVLREAKDANDQLREQRERMARIVIAAVEKIVPLQDPQGIYRQVLRTLSKSMQTVRYVIVRVCPDELAYAEDALKELATGSVFAKLIDVVADDRLAPGACLVESDQGIIDLSLASQLKALKAAIAASVVVGSDTDTEE